MFEFDGYHVLLTAMGACVLLALWLPRFVSGREPAAAALLILAGAAAFGVVPNIPRALDPNVRAANLGDRNRAHRDRCIVRRGPADRQRVRRRQLAADVAALDRRDAAHGDLGDIGWTVGGLTLAGAVLLAAVLSPTDPVLAGDLQVGPPLEGGEHPVRSRSPRRPA